MFVECECLLDAEALHNDPASAIGETPFLVVEELKYGPGISKVLVIDCKKLSGYWHW